MRLSLEEAALIRVMSMTVMVFGWLYLFGGLSGGRRIVAASVLDRVVLAPLVLVPLAIAGVFPHFLLAFAVLDPTLGIGAWLLLSPIGPPWISIDRRYAKLQLWEPRSPASADICRQ